MKRYVYPVSDFYIPYLLGREHSKMILIDFINTVLQDTKSRFIPVKSISILNPVISINLLDFSLFNDLEWPHNYFLLLDERTRSVVLSEKLEIHFFELPKINTQSVKKIGTRLEKWAYYLKNEGKTDEDDLRNLFQNEGFLTGSRRQNRRVF